MCVPWPSAGSETPLESGAGGGAPGLGATVQVAGLVPGDVAKIRVEAVGRSGAFGALLALKQSSPHRVSAPCPVVDRCGGCPWQMVRYDEQLREKHRALIELFSGTPLASIALEAVIPTPGEPPFGFREKVQMPVGGRAGDLLLGFWAPRSRDLIPVAHCLVQSPLLERVRARVVPVLNRHRLVPEEELRTVLLRAGDNAAYVTLVTRHDRRDLTAVGAELMTLPEVAAVYHNVNDTTGNRVLGPVTRHVAGPSPEEAPLFRTVGGTPHTLSATGFFQTNPHAAATLRGAVHASLGEGPILELYGGTGFLVRGLRGPVLLVEANPEAAAVAAASLPNARVRVEDAAALGWVSDAAGTIIADPPRSGLGVVVARALAQTGAHRLVYAACSPEALARDSHTLAEEGWRPRRAVPVDMFPHTPHVEVVATFERGV